MEAADQSSVAVYWDGNLRSGQYKVDYVKQGDAEWNLAACTVPATNVRKCTITGLSIGSTYSFRVLSQSEAGFSSLASTVASQAIASMLINWKTGVT